MGESESGYYLRHRGRVTGPHSLGELTQMIRRGSLGRAHDVSRDAVNWTPAGNVPELFGSAAPQVASASIQSMPAAAPSPQEPAAGPVAEACGMLYQHNGESFGPMHPTLLANLIQNGQLPRDVLVWIDGDTNSYRAADHPMLQPLLSASAGPDTTRPAKKKRSSGCGWMLLIAALIALAAGVYVAIKASKTDSNSKSDDSPPAHAGKPSQNLP